MGGRYIIPLDLGDSVGDRSLSYLRRGVGEKEQGKRVAAYIGGAKKKIVVDTGPPDLERSLKYHPYSKSDPRKPVDPDNIMRLNKFLDFVCREYFKHIHQKNYPQCSSKENDQ